MNLSGSKYYVVMTDKNATIIISPFAIANGDMLKPEYDFMSYIMGKIKEYAQSNPTNSVAIYTSMSSYRKLLHLAEYWQHVCMIIESYKNAYPSYTNLQLVEESHLTDFQRVDIIYNY